MERSERQLHLRLDASGAHDAPPRRLLHGVLQERRLADAGVPAHDQRPAPTGADGVEQSIQRRALGSTPQQHHVPTLHHGKPGWDQGPPGARWLRPSSTLGAMTVLAIAERAASIIG
jgi:hypothetical protein